MIYEKIHLNKYFKALGEEDEGATLQAYVIENSPEMFMDKKRPSVVICPGGGYQFVSDREGEPVAMAFVAKGYNAFVLRYSTAPKRYPQQLLEVAAAVAYVRQQSEAWHLETEQIAVCGFSAGGHLAGHLGVTWHEPWLEKELGVPQAMYKPNAMILGYPVVSSIAYAHQRSFQNVLGEEQFEVLRDTVSLEQLVTSHTPPTFLWHTAEDEVVDVENSLLLARALSKAKRPFELHIFPNGGHGMSLATEETRATYHPRLVDGHVAKWFTLAVEWLQGVYY